MIDAFEHRLLRNFGDGDRPYASQHTARASRTILAIFTLAGTLAFIASAFQGIVAPLTLRLWLGAVAVAALTPVICILAFAISGPGTSTAMQPYLLVSRAATFVLSSLVAAGVWILLPHASVPLQLLTLVFYVAFVAMMLGVDVSPVNMVEQSCLMGSAIVFVLVYRLPFALPLAIVLGAVTISLVGLGQMTHRSNQAVLTARADAEQANLALAVALAEVAAQRDAKTRFIAAASHDLRQPVQAAALYFENALSSQDSHLRKRAITGARRAFASVDALLETLLDHLRSEAGAATAHIVPVSIGDAIAGVVDRHGLAAQTAGIALISMPSRTFVLADDRHLSRVLDNVVGNAIRHSGASRILVGARRAGETVSIWVIDNGRGVTARDAPRLFDDYVQGSADRAKPGGFGIGLSSARRLMLVMHGELLFAPRWQNGAAFCLQIPVSPPVIEAALWKAA
jgi:signal transduction histidine kinase